MLRNRSRRQKGDGQLRITFQKKLFYNIFVISMEERYHTAVIELPACETVYHAHNWIVSRDLYSPDCFRQTNPTKSNTVMFDFAEIYCIESSKFLYLLVPTFLEVLISTVYNIATYKTPQNLTQP